MMASAALENPYCRVIVPPMASSARKEIAPIAVFATRKEDHFRALCAVKTEGVIFQRLVCDPFVVLASDPDDPLLRSHSRLHPLCLPALAILPITDGVVCCNAIYPLR